jgi:hypothetical protein
MKKANLIRYKWLENISFFGSKKRLFFLMLFLFGFFFSCSLDKTTEIPVINPGNLIEKEIGLSEIAENITKSLGMIFEAEYKT